MRDCQPRAWAEVALREVADIDLGKMLDAARSDGEPHSYLRNVNVRWDSIDLSDLLTMPFKTEELTRFEVRNGDLFVCEGGEPGRAALWNYGETEIKYQKALHRVRSHSGIRGRWILFQLMLDAATGKLRRCFTGSTIAHLPREKLAEYRLRVASTQEQDHIVEAIDDCLSRLDNAVASLERVRAKLKAYRAAVLKAAVEGKLVPTEAELARQEQREYEPAQVLLDRILRERRRRWEEAELARMTKAGKTPKDDSWKAKYEEPEAPEINKLPFLPEGWCWTTFDAIIASGPQNGLYVPKSQYGHGTPIVRIDDYQPFWSRSSSELTRVAISNAESSTYGLIEGDLVVNRVNSLTHLGKTLAVEARHLPAVFESNMMRLSVADGVESRFVQLYLSSSLGKRRLTANSKWAVNQASINQQDVCSCAIPLPSLVEQRRIVSEVERLSTCASAADTAVRLAHARSRRLRQSILKLAFEGKLVDQDPNDEPAEKLLERIKAERAASASEKKPRGRKPKAP